LTGRHDRSTDKPAGTRDAVRTTSWTPQETPKFLRHNDGERSRARPGRER
jgi:hypothetical protein